MTFLGGRLKEDPRTGLNSGIGFCEFSDKQTADKARRMNLKKSINGRLLRIDTPSGRGPTVVLAPQSYLTSLTRDEAYQMLVQVKSLVNTSPETARDILINNPSIVGALEELLSLNKLM